MKIKAIIASLSLTAMAAGALTVGIVNSNSGKNTSEVHATDYALIYFNLSQFGPTYEEDKVVKNTSFSVSAYGDTNADQAWYTVSAVDLEHSIFSVNCPTTVKHVMVLRAAEGIVNKWKSEGAWNQTAVFERTSSAQDYCWVWSSGPSNEQFGDSCDWRKTKGTNLNINGVSQEMSFNFLNNEYGATNLSLESTDSLTITKDGNTYGYSHLEDKSLFNEGTSNAFSPKNPSTFAVYLKDNGSIWAQIDSGVEAENWAEGFVKGVGCAAPYNAAPANWSTYAGTFLTLTDGAKDTLIGATASNEEGATYVQQAAFIHDMCVRKYTGCDVFMKRDGGGSRTVTPSNSINLVENNGNNYTAIVIIAVSVAIVSLSAAFIMLKKRKESK